ncbi:hypothetical protein, partial [Thiolapillus sp.]
QTIGSRSIRVTCSEEPDAGNPHVRFCEGESQQWPIYSTSLAFNDLPLFLENRDTQVVFSFLLGVDQLLCQAWIHRSLFQGSTSFLKPAAAGLPRRAGCPLSTPVRIRYGEDR